MIGLQQVVVCSDCAKGKYPVVGLGAAFFNLGLQAKCTSVNVR